MTTQLLATELANLIHESKRKHSDLRQAAEKSLEELKGLSTSSDQASLEELAQRHNFVNPFIIACGTRNAKFTEIAIVCLQRLIVARALPRSRVNQVLEALMQASSAGLDVQLKILQALPSLLQNYSADLNGNLLVTALNICFVLQGSKNAIVNNTAAATLQQLVVTVFDKVIAEDKNGTDTPAAGVAPTLDGEVELRPAALDAYRIFNDLCLMTENQRPEFLRFSGLPQTFGLELIESVITNHASVFKSHPEQADILRSRVMPLLLSAFKGKSNFATTVRLVRVLYTLLRRHINTLPDECGEALEVLTQLLDQDTSTWKRSLCMEVFRGVFAEYALLRRIYTLYDAQQDQKDIIKTLTATFVRLSTEKPAVIGLGHQSSLPVAVQDTSHSSSDQAILEATGMTGVVGASAGSETLTTGISTQWSSVRVPCIDQLDKTEPPTIPESYIYSLVLSCISSLSDGLAKFILPLTVPNEAKSRKKSSKSDNAQPSESPTTMEKGTQASRASVDRSVSFKKNPLPLNPLALDEHPLLPEVKICSALVEECWPAILATCSTFLYSALDSEYYHSLVRAFQRFAHVAGLLELSTPRDAFLTTLGKAAVPPNVLTACLNAGQNRPLSPHAPDTPQSPGNNSKGLLTTESLNVASNLNEKIRQPSFDAALASAGQLNTRNLLCLRALLNLGIALGPTLGRAWRIILDTLQQADLVLFITGKTGARPGSASRGQESGDADGASLMANFGNEVRSVETAASRLMESTIDFPNEPFVEVVQAMCDLLSQQKVENPASPPASFAGEQQKMLSAPSRTHKRVASFSLQSLPGSPQQDQFALAKLGDIAIINIERLLLYPPEESGWSLLTNELSRALVDTAMGATVRSRGAEILVKLTLEAANLSSEMPSDARRDIQIQILTTLKHAIDPLVRSTRKVSIADQASDVGIHKIILDGLKAIMDDCGDSLISGWEIAFEIIGSIFVVEDLNEGKRPAGSTPTSLGAKSPKLIRSAFSSLQLICSDLLTSLPRSCFLLLVDTVYKFCSQDDDLNIALTTVTFFWVLSDFLSGKTGSLDITAKLMQGSDISDLELLAGKEDMPGSEAALWMLLLLRLTSVSSDDRLELRNSAIQTLLRIFDAYGERLSPEAWSISVKSVLFKLLSSLESELRQVREDSAEESERAHWNGTAVVVVDGMSTLLADYLDVLLSHPSFAHLWRELLSHLATLLDFGALDISTAAFKALGHILSQYHESDKSGHKDLTIQSAWDLWARGIPVSTSQGGESDNQPCLTAYLVSLNEIYRLHQADLDLSKVQRMLGLLHETARAATVGTYSSDIEHPTPLQSQIIQATQMIRTDIEGVPSAVIKHVSRYVLLPFDGETPRANKRRTFVAMSKGSMQLLETLILEHSTKAEIYTSSSFAEALGSLVKPIQLKYGFAIVTRSTSPWRTATTTSLAILKAALPQLLRLDVSASVIEQIWSLIADVADGILSADCNEAPPSAKIDEDEAFDIAAFEQLLDLTIPALGSDVVPQAPRKAIAESLFKTSIIHPLAPSDHLVLRDGIDGALNLLKKPRAGRTTAVDSTRRTRMAYVALNELFAQSFARETDEKAGSTSASTFSHRARIAKTMAPCLVIRTALTLRMYIADQPLRGRMPQPLSQRKELTWTLRKIVDAKTEEEGFRGFGGEQGEARQHLLHLYPLLVQALRVTADDKVAILLREAMEAAGGELGL